jgi:hypothetical protein
MRIEDDALKKNYQGYVSAKIPANRNKCPSPRVLSNSFKSTSSHRNKKKIIDHITKCSCCAEEFKFLLELHSYQNSMINAINYNRQMSSSAFNFINPHSIGRFIGRFAYLLFGIALVLSSSFLILQKKELLEGRRTEEAKITLVYPIYKHTLPNPLIFQWKENISAQCYVLELFDDALLPVWTSPKITGTQLQLPDRIFSLLYLGKSYFWMITAFSSTEKIAESDLLQFSILNKQ